MANDLWHELLIGFCLMLILEGVIPFLYPKRWRNLVQQLSMIDDRTLRMIGLGSMLSGLGVLYWIN